MGTDFIAESVYSTERDIINGFINSRFIIDYGTIVADNGDGTANIQHAVPTTPRYPTSDFVLSPTITKNVEVLYLSGGQFSTNFKVTVGDPVLLVGLKDFVKSTQSIDGQPLTVFNHYNQNTLKAIPLAGSNAMAIAQINVVNGLLQIKTQSQSLYTILNTLMSSLQTFASPANWSTIGTAATAAGALLTSVTTLINNLAQLLTA